MHSEIAKIQESTLFRFRCNFRPPESVCKILVENWLNSQVVRANSSRQCETVLTVTCYYL